MHFGYLIIEGSILEGMKTITGLSEFRMVDGIVMWKNSNGELHRDDMSPALIQEGREEYYYYGKLYMVVYPDGTRYIINTQIFKSLSST